MGLRDCIGKTQNDSGRHEKEISSGGMTLMMSLNLVKAYRRCLSEKVRHYRWQGKVKEISSAGPGSSVRVLAAFKGNGRTLVDSIFWRIPAMSTWDFRQRHNRTHGVVQLPRPISEDHRFDLSWSASIPSRSHEVRTSCPMWRIFLIEDLFCRLSLWVLAASTKFRQMNAFTVYDYH